MNTTSDKPAAKEVRLAGARVKEVGPEEEKRENLHDEPSAAQAVKDDAQRQFRSEAEQEKSEGKLMGLDAPGFGKRNADDLRRMASSDSAGTMAREEATVDAEFSGMDNDLIDMGDFGAGGTGTGTQAGGAGERLRATGINQTVQQPPDTADAAKDK